VCVLFFIFYFLLNFTVVDEWLNQLSMWRGQIISHHHMEGWVLCSQGGKLQGVEISDD